MANLIEQKNVFMTKLQSLVDAKNAKISSQIDAYKAELMTEVDTKVQALKAKLEADKVTPEISQLVTFIHQIDAMLAYERNGAIEESESEDVEDEKEIANDEANAEQTNAGLDTIAADIADTRARLNAVSESKPNSSGIVLPRR